MTCLKSGLIMKAVFVAAALAPSFAPPAGLAQSAEPAVINGETLKLNPAPVGEGISGAVIAGNPGATGIYALYVKYAAGSKSVPHSHPDLRIVTIISGTFYAGSGPAFDESKLVPVKPGGVIVIPANAVHYGWAKDGEVILQETGTAPTANNIWPKAQAK